MWFGNTERVQAAVAVKNQLPEEVTDVDTAYAVYLIQNGMHKNFMQVAGNILYNEKYSDGSKIVLNKTEYYKDKIAGWQQWYVIYNKTEDGKKYYYIRNVFSGKLLKAPDNGTQLQQYFKSDSLADEELWQIKRVGATGKFYIINKKTNLALSSSDASADNIPVVLKTIKNNENQLWSFMPQSAVTYRDDEVVKFFNRNNKALGSVAFDEGMSIPLSYGANKGKVLWVTQDAWDGESLQLNNKFKCTDYFHYRNSVMIQPSVDDWNPNHTLNIIREGSLQHRPKQICDVMPHSEFAWPSAGVEIRNHVYLQCGEGDGLIFKRQSLYDLTESEGHLWKVKRTVPEGLKNDSLINYAAGMVKQNDGYVYVFGTMGKDFGYKLNVYVARFPVGKPQLWTFWNGSSWTSTPVPEDSARVAAGLGTASIAYVHHKYVMITMDQGFNCEEERNIYAAVSDSPTGPFGARKKVYSICEYMYGSYARYYTVAVHPEFDNGHNELLVTYCLNFSGCGVKDCKDGYLDPYFYRVKGIRIPYSQIGL
ncbi:hypothetical protein A9P82_10280 [Arachidicoccus ginsenosidimutans]|nr:hypothetical protein A9P82_10280 [Arachidicoccus sp. BS20]